MKTKLRLRKEKNNILRSSLRNLLTLSFVLLLTLYFNLLYSQTQLYYYDFESGTQSWTFTGASRSNNATWSCDSGAAIRTTNGGNVLTSPTLDISGGYNQIDINWCHNGRRLENGEGFTLEYYNGSAWSTLQTYVRGTDFNNGANYNNFTYTLNNPPTTFPNNAQIRFTSIASADNELNWFDSIEIVGYVPLSPCSEPGDQPTSLTFTTVTNTQIDGSFTAATSSPDNYLVVYNTTGTTPTPSDTSTYTIGGTVGAGNIVADNDSDTTFSVTGLTPNTTYYFYVFSFNSACSGGPDYLATSPLNSSQTTELYCIPLGSDSDYYINEFTTTGGLTNINNTTGYSTGGFGDFTSQSLSQVAGSTISFNAEFEDGDIAFDGYGFGIWVDWNNNGDFTDTGEDVFNLGYVDPATGSFIIPGGTATGSYRMRILADWDDPSPSPCTISSNNGEAEDYTLIVTTPTPCTEPANQPTALTFTNVTDTQMDGSFTAAASSPDYYLIVYNTTGTTPVPNDTTTYTIGGTVGAGNIVADTDNDTSFSLTGLTADTTYYFFVFSFNSACSGGPDYLVSSPLNNSQTTDAYCNPSNPHNTYYIDDFVTTGGLTNINHTSTGYSANGYGDFSATHSVSQLAGGSVNFSAAFNDIHGFGIWIDWNNDGTFDLSEQVYETPTTWLDPATGSFSVPGGTPVGSYRMRVLADWNIWSSLDPCDFDFNYGEAHDYTFIVGSLTPCSTPTDQPNVLILSPSGNTISGSFTAASPVPDNYLVWISTTNTPPSPVDGTSYNIGDTLGTGTIIDNDNDTSFFSSGLSPLTTYYIYVFSFNSNCAGSPPVYYTTGPLNGNTTTGTVSYCESLSTIDEQYLYISNVEFVGTLNDVTNTSTYSSSPQGYQDFTGQPNSIQAQGQGINIFMDSDGSASEVGRLKAWVDWDQSGTFDASELEYDSYAGVFSTTFGILIDAAQAPGEYRVRLKYYTAYRYYGSPYWVWAHDAQYYDYDACYDFTTGGSGLSEYWEYGETEDYTFTVIESCAATITNITDGYNCGDGTVDLVVTGSPGTTEFRFYDAFTGGSLIDTDADGNWTTPFLNSTTDYYVTSWNGSCESLVRTKVTATIKEITDLTFSPTTLEPCGEDDILTVTASAANEVVYLVDEGFDSGTLGTFSLNNIISNLSPMDDETEWQVRTSPYVPALQVWYPAIASGFTGDYFVMANADFGVNPLTSNVDPVETALELTTSVNTTDFTDLTLNFDMYFSRYYLSTPEDVNIEVSTNGGTSWSLIQQYTNDVGWGTAMVPHSLNLNAYVDESDLKIRIRYYSSHWCDGVAIDNIELFGNRPVTSSFTWTAPTLINVYTDAAATIPYVLGDQLAQVYVKLTPAGLLQGSFSFDVTAVLTNGCDVTETIPVTNFTKTWNDVGDVDWDDGSKWLPLGVPTEDNCVIIHTDTQIPNDSAPIPPGPGYNAYARNLTIKPTGNLELREDQNLVVTEWINIESGGNFDIMDNANFIQIDDVVSNLNTGTAEVNREVLGLGQYDYVYWSTPVETFNVENISPGTSASGRWKWIPTVANGTSGNHGEWQSASGAMTLGEGVAIRNLIGTSTTQTALFDGKLNNGQISVAISRGTYTGADYSGIGNTATANDDNWNLIGNPYPSAISAADFTAANPEIDGTLYFWQHSAPPSNAVIDPFYEDFGYNYSESDYLAVNTFGSNPPGFNGNIAGGQSFFALMLDTASTPNTVSFSNTMRYLDIAGTNTPYDNTNFFKTNSNSVQSNTESSTEKHRIWLDLVDSNNKATSILVGYATGATDDIDRLYDGFELNETSRRFYSLDLNSNKFAIQAKALPFDIEDSIPLGFAIPNPGTYSIALNIIDGLFEFTNQNIYLEDTLSGIIHDLRATPYSFFTESGTFNNRFILRFTNETLGLTNIIEDNEITISAFNNSIKTTSSNTKIKSFELFDVAGRLIHRELNVNALNYVFNNSQLSEGAYVVKLKLDNGKSISKKVIL